MEATVYSKIRLTSKDKTSLAPAVASWRSLHNEIKGLPDSNDSLTRLAQMMALELARDGDGPRAQLLARLHMRINAMRQRMEVDGIEQAAGVKIIKGRITNARIDAATAAVKALNATRKVNAAIAKAKPKAKH